MALADRLRELRAGGKPELAVTLASEALRKEDPWVTLNDDHVQVRTKTFVGEHPHSGTFDATDRRAIESAVERRGTYRLRETDDTTNGFTFSSGCHQDAIVNALLREEDDAHDGTTEASDDDERERTAVTPDGPSVSARSDPSPSFLEQAIAAVQNQLRG